ncbi:flagellar hook protein FlgE [Pseudaeromonas pectinilytica]
MSFNIALSGINAAQKDLDVTANNIANVNTIGFKESRAEFADVYASSLFTATRTKTGDGVTTGAVAQQFHQGALQFTNNPFDLAISGPGYFVTSAESGSLDFSYTRAGAFKLNKSNFLVDSSGNYLRGFPVNSDGTSTSVSLGTSTPIQIPETAGTPVSTKNIDIALNLSSKDTAKDLALFDPTDPKTYSSSTSVTTYDSLGEPHTVAMYFVKPKDAAYTGNNNWTMFTTVDNKPVNMWDTTAGAAVSGTYQVDADKDGAPDGAPIDAKVTYNGNPWTGAVITFDDLGVMKSTTPADLNTQALGVDDPSSALAGDGANVLGLGADGTQRFKLNFDTAKTTQFGSKFEVTSLEQDGLTVGRLTGVDVGSDGLVKATYSNGTSQPLARVAMARFSNEQGLRQSGNTSWKESQDSGVALAGEANTGTFGAIKSAALEQSNVNLTAELVDLITAQRNFQANSRALEVNNTLQQSILQIR